MAIAAEVNGAAPGTSLTPYRLEIDDLVPDVVRSARQREPSTRTMTTVAMAIDLARSAIASRPDDARAGSGSPPAAGDEQDRRRLVVTVSPSPVPVMKGLA